MIFPFYSARYVEVERDICCDRGKNRETILSSLQACFAIAHSSGDFLYIYILFPFFSLYLLTGYYLYIETSTGIVGSKAVLVSPQYQQAYSNCKLKFSYHMYGRTVGSLAVFLNDGTSRTRMMMLIGLYSKQLVYDSYNPLHPCTDVFSDCLSLHTLKSECIFSKCSLIIS